jgi:hypothetical protein
MRHWGIRYNRVLGERVEHVTKCRKPMLRDIGEAKDEVAERYAKLVDELEATRQELLDLRATEVWVAIYPNALLTNEPNVVSLVGGSRRLQEPHLPRLEGAVVAASIFSLLRADRRFCESVATTEQAAAERGVSVGNLTGRDARWLSDGGVDFVGPRFDAAWGGSPEEKRQADRIVAYTEATRDRGWGE